MWRENSDRGTEKQRVRLLLEVQVPLWMEMCEMLICGYLPPTKALGQSSAFELSYTLLYISSMDSGVIYQVQLNVNKHVSTVNKQIALEQHI